MEIAWFLWTKAVLIFLQDGFETINTDDIGSCPGSIIIAFLDFFVRKAVVFGFSWLFIDN